MFSAADGAPLPIVASVFTPFQLLVLEALVTEIGTRPMLVLDSRGPAQRGARPCVIPGATTLTLDLTGKVNDSGQADMLREGLAAAATFAGNGQPVAFVCASYQWPINTALLHRHRRDRGWRFFLMDDGLSSYLDLQRSVRERIRNPIRELVARVRGFPARALYAGHPLGHDLPEVAAIMLALEPSPHVKWRDKVISLPMRADALDGAGDAALFLGQPLLDTYGEAVLAPFVARVHAWLAANGFQHIAFKPHHFQSQAEIALYHRAGFAPFERAGAIEQIIAGSGFGAVAAVSSTALLTSKALFGDSIRALAFDLTRFPPRHEQRDVQEMTALFTRAGVELIAIGPESGASA